MWQFVFFSCLTLQPNVATKIRIEKSACLNYSRCTTAPPKWSILVPDIYLIFCFSSCGYHFFSFSKPPLILVSLDGFRAEYLKDHSSHIPVINKLRKSRVDSWAGGVFGPHEEWQTNTLLQERLEPQQHTWGLSIPQRPSPTITPSSLWVVAVICELQKLSRILLQVKEHFLLHPSHETMEIYIYNITWTNKPK